MQLTERHIKVNDPQLDNLCWLSKNLYNAANYYVRRRFFNSGRFLSAFPLIRIFRRTNQPDFRALPSMTSSSILVQLENNWKSFFRLSKDYKKNPQKYKGKPKLPKFKHKIKGRNIVIFTGHNQVRLKEGFIHFPKKVNLAPLKTKVSNVKQVRIIPQATCYVIEVIYEKEIEEHDLKPDTHLSIDLGINNLATCFNDDDNTSFIVNGRPLKSINAYFNKLLAKAKSFIGVGSSNRIKRITHKRNCKVQDYLHKTSRFIVNYCLEHKLSTIIIGKNKNWKQKVNLGKRTNQNFVLIPFDILIKQVEYKAKMVGIEVVTNEESYTSKCDALALESVKKHKTYKGKRINRGLFKSSAGKVINADLNGALNILRKVIPNAFADGIQGVGLHPVRINF